ncbi:MAG TPA: nuclear transport factor 2 family protein [Pseudolabrys sp.]|nr:nuclear transport factor 2 family protein [Pseudolabrys sp.]
MTKPVPRSVVEGFYKALATSDFTALAPYLADDVTWTISGPVDILPFCGQRHGKAVVLKLLDRDIPAFLEKRRLVPSVMLVDGDRASVFGRLTASRGDIGRRISYRIAQFIRFENEKAVDYVSLIDSFDAVEQVLGQQLTLGGAGTAGELLAI